MVKFILEIIIFLSLGFILYLAAKTLPRISESDTDLSSARSRWFTLYLEKIDEWLEFFLEKILRRVRVLIMKLDNVITKQLNRFKKEPQKEVAFGGEEKKENGSAAGTV